MPDLYPAIVADVDSTLLFTKTFRCSAGNLRDLVDNFGNWRTGFLVANPNAAIRSIRLEGGGAGPAWLLVITGQTDTAAPTDVPLTQARFALREIQDNAAAIDRQYLEAVQELIAEAGAGASIEVRETLSACGGDGATWGVGYFCELIPAPPP